MLDIRKSSAESPSATIVVPSSTSVIQYRAVTSGLALTYISPLTWPSSRTNSCLVFVYIPTVTCMA